MILCPKCGTGITRVDIHFEAWREVELVKNDISRGEAVSFREALPVVLSELSDPDVSEITEIRVYCHNCGHDMEAIFDDDDLIVGVLELRGTR